MRIDGPTSNHYSSFLNRYMSLRGGRGFSRVNGNKWVREAMGTGIPLAPKPIHSGPRPNRSWRRIAAIGTGTTQSDACMEATDVPSADVAETTVDVQTLQTGSTTTPNVDCVTDDPPDRASSSAQHGSEHHSALHKKGRNKLIRQPHSDRGFSGVSKGDGTATVVTEDSLRAPALPVVHDMKRLGSNKLVLKKSTPPTELTITSIAARSSPTTIPPSAGTDVLARMKATGRNKLVSRSRLEEERLIKQNLKRRRIDAREAVEGAGLTHKGRNKLVSESLAQKEEERLKRALVQRRDETRRSRANGPVKRIKLLPGDNQISEVKLTDFSYQTTSQSNFRSMGLVRIAPDNSAPVCPSFSRGIPCTKPNCTKRHDVSIESATPVCSFFQRHGQCLKRDSCPFRHIKINPHASVCEQFSRLGYCEDQDCTLRHVKERAFDTSTRVSK